MKPCKFKQCDDNVYICEICGCKWINKLGAKNPPIIECGIKNIVNAVEIPIIKNSNTNKQTQMPSSWTRMKSYADAYIHWNLAGRPLRIQEKIDLIFNEYCKKCNMYNGYACKICGCYINQRKYLNKIAWATTRCPANPPQWVEEDGFTPAVIEQPKGQPLAENQLPQPPTEQEIELARIEAENNIVAPTQAQLQSNGGGGCGCNRVGKS